MAINEVFPNPTVTAVNFEVRFPNLFFIDSKIGDFQLSVMERFPESDVLYRRQFFVADVPPGAEPPAVSFNPDDGAARKAWQFKSPENYEFTLESDRLWIRSRLHKTYSNGEGPRFRDAVKFVVDSFLKVLPIPLFLRVGLRYQDDCPILDKSNDRFREWYNTTFPLDRFSLSDAQELHFRTVVKRGESSLRFVEELGKNKAGEPVLKLDFDGFRERVPTANYIQVTDELHDLVANAFQESIKAPVYEHMRRPKEG